VAALGLTMEELDADTRQQLGLKAGEGVAIGNVSGAAAARAGLQAGDVVLMVNQRRIGSVAAFREATRGLKPGDTVLLLVRRGDASQFVSVTVPDDDK
jgi:serine protease Do